MKKTLKKIGILILLSLPVMVMAQNGEKEIIRDDSGKEVLIKQGKDAWLLGDIWDNWFFGANIGIHSFIGNELESSKRFNGIQPDFNIEVGKWLTPAVAIALNVDGFNGKGQSKYGGCPYIDTSTGEWQKFNFYYVAVNGEVKLDFVNLFAGYSKGRKAQVHPQLVIGLGFGWQTGKNISQKQYTPNNFELSFIGGIDNDVRVTKWMSITQSLKCMLLRGSFDYSPGVNDKSRYDIMPSLTVGVKFHIIKKARHVFIQGVTDTVVVEKEIENMALQSALDQKNRELDSLQDAAQKAKDELAAINIPLPSQILDAATRFGLDYTTVFYIIDKSDIDYNGEMKLMAAAKKIKESKDGVKYLIIGGADKATGTTHRNKELSEERCEAVKNVLVNKFGVNPDKLEMHPLGSILDYDPVELNRMTIVIENAPAILEILENDKANRTNNK